MRRAVACVLFVLALTRLGPGERAASSAPGGGGGPGTVPPEDTACLALPVEGLLDKLTRPSPDLAVAGCVTSHPSGFSALLLRPAFTAVGTTADQTLLQPLSRVVAGVGTPPDPEIDGTTRATAARALGRILGRLRNEGPRFRVPGAVINRLEDCIAGTTPPLLRMACVRAASDGGTVELIPALEDLVVSGTPLEQLAALQALTRLTGVDRVTPVITDEAGDQLDELLETP